jgi:hypothetical protein
MWAKLCKEEGWEAVCYIRDEPNGAAAFQQINTMASTVHKGGENLKVLVTCGAKKECFGSIDIWCPLFFSTKGAEARIAEGDEYWTYTALAQGKNPTPWWQLDQPVMNHRVSEWMCYRRRATGILYWTVTNWPPKGRNCPTKDIWTDARCYQFDEDGKFYQGDGSLLYPGPDIGYNGPVGSLRFKALRDGMDDHDYLKILEARTDRATVEAIASKVCTDFFTWEKDPAKILAAREALAKAILAAPAK